MGLFKYPRSETDSFGEALLKQLLVSAGTAAVGGGVQGALGNYFQNKLDTQRHSRDLDLAERKANQSSALRDRAEVAQFVQGMPKDRAWTIYQGLKDNPEMLTAKMGGVGMLPRKPEQMGPELPLPDSSVPKPFIESLRVTNPVEQFQQEDPEAFSRWNDPEKWGMKKASFLASLKPRGKTQEELENAKEVARIRAGGGVESSKIRATATRKKADAAQGGPLPPSKDPTFNMLKTVYQAAESAARNPVSGILDESRVPALNAAKKAFVSYARGTGMSDQQISEILTPSAVFPSGGGEPPPGPMSKEYSRDDALKALSQAAQGAGVPMPSGQELENEISRWLSRKKGK